VTTYSRGRKFEWAVRDHLAENGYSVMRMAGSKGNAKVDLVAIKPGQQLYVQCKVSSAALGPAEWNRLVEVAGWVGAVPILASKGGRGEGIQFGELTGPKIPRARTQPIRRFVVDEIAEAAA
jgi:Holliday junction resolvase